MDDKVHNSELTNINDLKIEKSMEFIQIVKREKGIYDFTDPNYKNAEKKSLSWQRVASSTGMTVDGAKRKWKNLRDSYTKYLKTVRTRKNTNSRKYQCWAHAQTMDFLRPFQGPPRSRKKESYDDIRIINANDYETMKYGEDEQTIDYTSQSYEPMQSNENDTQISSFDQQNLQTNQYEVMSSYNNSVFSPVEISRVTSENENKKTSHISKESVQSFDSNLFNGGSQHQTTTPNKKVTLRATDLDSTSLFFLSLAKSVRKMPAKYQARIKVQCLQAVNEVELTLEELAINEFKSALPNLQIQNDWKISKIKEVPLNLDKNYTSQNTQHSQNSEHFTYEMSPANVEGMIEITSSDDEN